MIRRNDNRFAGDFAGDATVPRMGIHPETKFEFIDRFLVTCEAYKIPATIILMPRRTAAP